MTTFALNNLWNYLQGLSLSQSDREWLADKLIMPKKSISELSAEDEAHYQTMKNRDNGRPTNRTIILDD